MIPNYLIINQMVDCNRQTSLSDSPARVQMGPSASPQMQSALWTSEWG